MWLNTILVLSLLFYCNNCENEGNISLLNAILTPVSKDYQRLLSFSEDIAQFSRGLVPFSEFFAKSALEKKEPVLSVLQITKAIRKRFVDIRTIRSIFSISIDSWYLLESHSEAYRKTDEMLSLAETMANGNATEKQINSFSGKCFDHPFHIAYVYNNDIDNCANERFSPKSASAIFELIDSFQYVNYSLTSAEKRMFSRLFGSMYFALEEVKGATDAVQKFIVDKKGHLYENKLKLLEDVKRQFMRIWPWMHDFHDVHSNCLLLDAFIFNHFNNDILLQMADIFTGQGYALTYIFRMCSSNFDITAEEYLRGMESKLKNQVYSFIPGWFDSLLQRTWPKTETELIRGFMKEAAGGREIPEDSGEYSRIANVVHDRMKSIGHPSYIRQYIVTAEGVNRNFASNCRKNTCSLGISMGAQCTTLRIPRNKTDVKAIRENFSNFTTEMNPILVDTMEKYHSSWNVRKIIEMLAVEKNFCLGEFTNHSSYIGLRKWRYWKNCTVSYGLSANNDVDLPIIQEFRYHNDGGLFTTCNDWLFLLGI